MATSDLPRDIGGFIRDLRRNARISLRQLAEQAGVSNPYLSQIERGLRKPSAEVLQQLASALRVSTPVMYLRAGLLDALDAKEGQGVLAAIAADPDLTVSQKQSLSQIYETFRRENERHAEAAADQSSETVRGENERQAHQSSETPRHQSARHAAAAGSGAESQPADAVVESVAVTEAGAAPPPKPAKHPKSTKNPNTKNPKKKTSAPAAEEEKR